MKNPFIFMLFLSLMSCKTTRNVESSSLTSIQVKPPTRDKFPKDSPIDLLKKIEVTLTRQSNDSFLECSANIKKEKYNLVLDSNLPVSFTVYQKCDHSLRVALLGQEDEDLYIGIQSIPSTEIVGKTTYSATINLRPTPEGRKVGFLEKVAMEPPEGTDPSEEFPETSVEVDFSVNERGFVDVSEGFQVQEFKISETEVEVTIARTNNLGYTARCYLGIFQEGSEKAESELRLSIRSSEKVASIKRSMTVASQSQVKIIYCVTTQSAFDRRKLLPPD